MKAEGAIRAEGYMKHPTIIAALALLLLLATGAGCRRAEPDPGRSSSSSKPAPAPASVAPEAWASSPPAQWPQIVLTNRATFAGHSGLNGASAFLVRTDKGRTLAATAKHLIGPNGGVKPEIAVEELDQSVQSWRMYPRTLPDQFFEVEKVGVQGLDGWGLDWLVLSLKTPPGALPSVPLRMRREPAFLGERVYLVGCPYAERSCRQNVYTGVVTVRGRGDRFRYDLTPPVDIRGFSGAPILDAGGHVVGVMTIWFETKTEGGKDIEAGAEDAAAVLALLVDQ